MGWKFWKREPNPMDPMERPQDAVPAGASAGDNVGLLLEGVAKDQVLSGDVISR